MKTDDTQTLEILSNLGAQIILHQTAVVLQNSGHLKDGKQEIAIDWDTLKTDRLLVAVRMVGSDDVQAYEIPTEQLLAMLTPKF